MNSIIQRIEEAQDTIALEQSRQAHLALEGRFVAEAFFTAAENGTELPLGLKDIARKIRESRERERRAQAVIEELA